MPEQLSKMAQQEIQRIVDGMIQGGALEEAAGAELRGHLEDKTLAYLNGEQGLSEADALLLAREHFDGDRGLTARLMEVHQPARAVLLSRELLAFFILTFALQQVGGLFITSLHFIPNAFLFSPLVGLLGLGIIYLVLRHWRAQILSGAHPWFKRCSLSLLWILIGLLIMAPLPVGMFWLTFGSQNLPVLDVPSARFMQQMLAPVLLLSAVLVSAKLYLALWWMGVPRHDNSHVMRQIAVCALVIWLYSVPHQLLPGTLIPYIITGNFPVSTILPLFWGVGFSTLLLMANAFLCYLAYRCMGPRGKVMQVAG